MEPIRIGILGCAKINGPAILEPVRNGAPATVVAIASRDLERARAYAGTHGISTAHGSYEALLADDRVEAVYIGLPNSLHCEWSIRAMQAGKAVLCEKPLSSNADEAELMAAASAKTGRPLVEAYHWRYHPVAARLREILDGGVLGGIRSIALRFLLPKSLITADNIRLNYELAGGAVMDPGCYCIDFMHFVQPGATPTVTAVNMAMSSNPGVDATTSAELAFPDGCVGRFEASIAADVETYLIEAEVRGTKGSLSITNPFAPHIGSRIATTVDGITHEEFPTQTPSYLYQLQAFARLLREGTPMPTMAEMGIRNMELIDAIYRKAGQPLRGG